LTMLQDDGSRVLDVARKRLKAAERQKTSALGMLDDAINLTIYANSTLKTAQNILEQANSEVEESKVMLGNAELACEVIKIDID